MQNKEVVTSNIKSMWIVFWCARIPKRRLFIFILYLSDVCCSVSRLYNVILQIRHAIASPRKVNHLNSKYIMVFEEGNNQSPHCLCLKNF